MKACYSFLSVLMLTFLFNSCIAQNSADRVVGGPCEGCEALLEYGDKKLSSMDTLPLFTSQVPKIKIYGTVYQKDGKTHAPDVILYIYHTDRTGIYPNKGNEEGWAKRHGFIQGWVKTDAQGNYTFFTFRPAAYPDGTEAEHIHLTVKEPNTVPYYLDDFVFDGDPILTLEKRAKLLNRGGSGIAKAKLENGVWLIERDLILGLNIPEYD